MNTPLKSLLPYIEVDFLNLNKNLNDETKNHCIRTALSMRNLCEKMDIDYATSHKLIVSAYLHDIGKYYIPEKILMKKGHLTPLERTVVDMHSYYGYKHLMALGVDKDICELVLLHHGLSRYRGEAEFPSERAIYNSAILKVCDAYDALTSNRAYRPSLSKEDAIRTMKSTTETFDLGIIALLEDTSWLVDEESFNEQYAKNDKGIYLVS